MTNRIRQLKPQANWLRLWRLRMALAALGVAALALLLWKALGTVGIIGCGVGYLLALLVLLYAWGTWWYLPRLWASLQYEITAESVRVQGGVGGQRIHFLAREGLYQALMTAGPLERLLGLCNLHLLCGGRQAVLWGLSTAQARRVQRYLCHAFKSGEA